MTRYRCILTVLVVVVVFMSYPTTTPTTPQDPVTVTEASSEPTLDPVCMDPADRPGTGTCPFCSSDQYCITYCCASGVGNCTMIGKCRCML